MYLTLVFQLIHIEFVSVQDMFLLYSLLVFKYKTLHKGGGPMWGEGEGEGGLITGRDFLSPD